MFSKLILSALLHLWMYTVVVWGSKIGVNKYECECDGACPLGDWVGRKRKVQKYILETHCTIRFLTKDGEIDGKIILWQVKWLFGGGFRCLQTFNEMLYQQLRTGDEVKHKRRFDLVIIGCTNIVASHHINRICRCMIGAVNSSTTTIITKSVISINLL